MSADRLEILVQQLLDAQRKTNTLLSEILSQQQALSRQVVDVGLHVIAVRKSVEDRTALSR